MDKKNKVIDTARELFTQYGYKKVTMDEIALKSGVTKKTIYTYFKDKESMFEYFIKEELENMKNEIEKNKIENKPFIEKVSNSVYKMLQYKNNSNLISNIVKESLFENSETKKFLKLYDDEIINYIEKNIEEEMKKNNIKNCDTHLTSFIIYKVYISVMFEYDKEINEKKVTQEITSILKDGILK